MKYFLNGCSPPSNMNARAATILQHILPIAVYKQHSIRSTIPATKYINTRDSAPVTPNTLKASQRGLPFFYLVVSNVAHHILLL